MNYIETQKIHTIFLMLGFACNFNCKYCMQHDFKLKEVQNTSYNKDIIKFIEQQADKNEHIDIMFFGGEPLLYMNTIRDIVQNISYKDNIRYAMITNGSLLNEENVDFLNKHNFNISISWDGSNTELSRGIDVFKTNKENIFKLKNGFGISSVLNAYNSPLTLLQDIEELNEEYKEVYGDDIAFNIDNLYYLDNTNSDIFLLDFKKYKNDMDILINKYIHNMDDISSIEYQYIKRYIDSINNYSENFEMKFSSCMSGISVLNMDLNGTLYLCHNNSDKILGNIYSNIDEYIKKYIQYNNIPNYYNNFCKKCNIRFCCPNGCMLLSEDEMKNFYCVQKKNIIEPILENLLKIVK